MTRYVIDVSAVLHLARLEVEVSEEHELLAPTLLRSQVLSTLHELTHSDEITPIEAQELLDRVFGFRMRLLGDAVLRKVAWEIADDLGWPSTYEAEYLALTKLQGDAFVTLDKDLERRARGIVPFASIGALTG